MENPPDWLWAKITTGDRVTALCNCTPWASELCLAIVTPRLRSCAWLS